MGDVLPFQRPVPKPRRIRSHDLGYPQPADEEAARALTEAHGFKAAPGREGVCQSCGSSRMYTAVSPPFCLNCDAVHAAMDGTKLTLDPEWLRRNGFASAPEDDS
jgi:hypothetical protein